MSSFPLKQCTQNDSSPAKQMIKCPAVSFNNASWHAQVKGAVKDIMMHIVIMKLIVLHNFCVTLCYSTARLCTGCFLTDLFPQITKTKKIT